MREIAWITLFLAGLLEMGWALGLRYTDGFTKVGPSVATLVVMAGSVYLLSRSLSGLPLGAAYCMGRNRGGRGGYRRDHPLRRVAERCPPPLSPSGYIGDRGAEALP